MLNVLNKYSFFNACDTARQKQIQAAASPIKLASDTEVYTRDCICDHVLLIGSGQLRVFTLSPDGREISLYHVSRGGTCPVNIISVILQRPAQAVARSVSEVTAAVLPADYFRRCVVEDNVIRNFAFTAMADRLTDVIDLVEHVNFSTLEQRLAGFLCAQVDEFNGASSPVLSITHDQIASELGSAREVISRLLRDMERRGGVSLGRGHIQINNINLLKNIQNYSRH